MSWLPVTFTTCGHEQDEDTPRDGVGLQPPKPPKTPHCCPGPTHRLVGDDKLDDGEGVEDSDGGNVPGRGWGCQGVPAVPPRLGHCLVLPS